MQKVKRCIARRRERRAHRSQQEHSGTFVCSRVTRILRLPIVLGQRKFHLTNTLCINPTAASRADTTYHAQQQIGRKRKAEILNDRGVDVHFAPEDDLITFTNEVAKFDWRIKRIKTEHLAILAEKITATLKFRQALPSTLRYEPQEPPNLLTLPRELRDRIYEFCGLTIKNYRVQNSSQPFRLNLCHEGKRTRSESPERRGKRGSKPVPISEQDVTVHMKINWPRELPELRLICGQVYNELVGPTFESRSLSLVINTTHVTGTPAIDWEMAIPQWATRSLQQLNVEVRCSMPQWKVIRDSLCRKLRYMRPQPKVEVRIVIMQPRAEQEAFIGTLPAYCRDGYISYFRTGWWCSYAALFDGEFEALGSIDSVAMLQILYLLDDVSLAKTYRFEGTVARFVIHTNDGTKREKVVDTNVYYGRGSKLLASSAFAEL